MSFILALIDNLVALLTSLNKFIEEKNKQVKIAKLSIARNTSSIGFLISFLLANFTAMLAIIFKDSLGTFGLIFPISSCLVLYGLCLGFMKNILFFNKEKSFYVREFKENNNQIK